MSTSQFRDRSPILGRSMTEKCEEFASNRQMPSCIDTNAITQITTKIHNIRWTIKDVSKIAFDLKVIGPNFHLTPSCLASVAFKRNERNLYVYLCNKSDVEIEMMRTIFLLDCNEKKLHEDTDGKTFTLEKNIEVDVLGSVEDRNRFTLLPNNTLIIDLSISMRGEITTEICSFQQVVDPKKKLIEDFKTMQNDSVNSDISLQVGDESIAAHWSILCARSSYFKKMFDSEMLERQQNTVTITDVSLSNLKKLISFLYTAEFVENDNDNLEELVDLYYVADKYEVMDLRALCSSKIMSKSTTNNICQILQLAHRHNDKNLKMQAMNYIHFHSDAVFQTEGWKKFEANEPLSAELFSFCARKNKAW